MQVTEVSLLGVRGFSPSLRLSLTPGYNVLQPSSGEAVPFGVLLAAMLHPEGWSQDGHLAAADADAAKVALGLLGGDQLLYRVLRQLGTAGVVQRLPRGAPAPEVLAQDVAGAGHLVQSATAVLSNFQGVEHVWWGVQSAVPAQNGALGDTGAAWSGLGE